MNASENQINQTLLFSVYCLIYLEKQEANILNKREGGPRKLFVRISFHFILGGKK